MAWIEKTPFFTRVVINRIFPGDRQEQRDRVCPVIGGDHVAKRCIIRLCRQMCILRKPLINRDKKE
jgi:predicted dinucleotide-binding enzyme